MSESQEKTEEPTQKKLDDAYRRGEGPQRKNTQAAIVVIATVLLVLTLAPAIARAVLGLIALAGSAANADFAESRAAMIERMTDLLFLLVPGLLAIGLLLALVSLTLGGFQLPIEKLKPNFGKFNPVANAKNIVALDNLYNFAHQIVFAVMVGLIGHIVITSHVGDGIRGQACGIHCLPDLFSRVLLKFLSLVIGLLVVLWAIDFLIQRRLFRRKQKMTKQEIKQEHKNSQGNPEIKQQRKQIARETIDLPGFGDITHAVSSPAVLVAIACHRQRQPYPFVVAKLNGAQANQLVRRLRQRGVAIVNLPAVANRIDRDSRAGDYLSKANLEDFAEVMAASQER